VFQKKSPAKTPKNPVKKSPRKNQKKKGTTALHDLREAARRLVAEEKARTKATKTKASGVKSDG